jgi:hypothetical protein
VTPDPDAGEEVVLGEVSQVGRSHVGYASLIDFSIGYQVTFN